MTADPFGAAVKLREILEQLIGQCAMRARLLDRCVWGWQDESGEKLRLMADIEKLMKITERAQKVLTRMRKDRLDVESCRCSCEAGACETLVAAMLLLRDEPGPEPAVTNAPALPGPDADAAPRRDIPRTDGAPPAEAPCASDCMTLAEQFGPDA